MDTRRAVAKDHIVRQLEEARQRARWNYLMKTQKAASWAPETGTGTANLDQTAFGSDYKVPRRGSWATPPHAIRNTFRNGDYPIRRRMFVGFRCAK